MGADNSFRARTLLEGAIRPLKFELHQHHCAEQLRSVTAMNGAPRVVQLSSRIQF
jgi:hypothetical protein